MNVSGCVPLDEVWGSIKKTPPPSPRKVTFKEKTSAEHNEKLLLFQLLQELKGIREEQQRNNNTLWMTLAAGFLLLLLALSSISQTFKRMETTIQKLSWYIDTKMLIKPFNSPA